MWVRMTFARCVFASALLVASACGSEFTAGNPGDPMGGSGGSAASGASAGGSAASGASGGTSSGTGATSGGGNDPGDAGESGAGATSTPGGAPAAAGAGGSGETPVDTSGVPRAGLVLWLRADLGVTQQNGSVTAWQDQSEAAVPVTQSASNARPRYEPEGFVGKPSVVFDGAEDFLTLGEFSADFSAGLSIFIAFQDEPVAAECTGFFEISNGREIDDIHVGRHELSLQYEILDDWHRADPDPPAPRAQIMSVVHRGSRQAVLRRNGNLLEQFEISLPVHTPRSEAFIARSLYSLCTYYRGAISEILVYARPVSEIELGEIESYLQRHWGCCTE
jgi:hypothetical protein